MRKFTLFDLVQLYRAPHQEGLDLPGARAPHVPPTTDPEQLAAEAAEAAALNGGGDDDNGLEDIGNADLLAENNQDRPQEKKTRLEQHEDLMEQLAAKRKKFLKDSDGEASNIDVDPDNVDDNANPNVQLDAGLPGIAPPQQQQPQPVEEVNGFYTAQDGTERYRTTVNGQTFDISGEEARAAIQDNERNRSGQAQQQQPVPPVAQQQAPVTTQQTNADAVNAELARLRQERRTALMDMYNGDETAIDRLDDIDSKILQATVDSVDVVGRMTQHTQQENAARWQSQIGNDEKEILADPRYAAVTSNPAAWELAVREAGRIMNETKAHLSGARPLSVMQQAVDNIMKAIGEKPAAEVTTPAVVPVNSPDSVRQQRKQQMGNTAVTAGAAPQIRQRTAAPAPVPDGGASPQQSRAAAMRELRKAKGEKN